MDSEPKIRFGHALPGAGMPGSAPSYDYAHLIGRDVTVSYGDHNIAFERILPRDGKVCRQIALKDWGADWLVVELNEPIEYAGQSLQKILVRARWLGCPIGSEFALVFLLLDSRNAIDTQDEWVAADFDFACWAQVQLKDLKQSSPH